MENFNSHKSYRPLTVLTFRLNYALSGLDPAAFHITNVLLHAVTCVLFFLLANKYFHDVRASFVAALVFAVHSVHTEAVCSTVHHHRLFIAPRLPTWWAVLSLSAAHSSSHASLHTPTW